MLALGAGAAKPSVMFISVDTLRADYLGCYGHEFNSSPHIDAFAKESLVFEDCVCEVPLTNPSFGAMMASRYPRSTGTTRNGLPMPRDVPLLTEAFRAAGYQTGCVQSNWTLRAQLSGLHRGFDTYDQDFHKKRWGFMKPERYADDVTDRALKLLETRDPAKPFFYWIHYSDPHAPYRYHRDLNPRGERLFVSRGEDRIRIKYDSEVAYTDLHIGRLLEAVPRENTIVIFTADHGESLHEHNYLGHGRRIYQDNHHIPFIIRADAMAPGRSSAPVCTLDFAPTILALAGLPADPGMIGVDLTREQPSSRTRFIETYGGAVPKVPGAKAIMADNRPMRRGVIQDGWKLILGGTDTELYYLPDDPGELKNLADNEPDRVREFTRLVSEWDQAHPRGKAGPAKLDKQDLEALRSLGYLD